MVSLTILRVTPPVACLGSCCGGRCGSVHASAAHYGTLLLCILAQDHIVTFANVIRIRVAFRWLPNSIANTADEIFVEKGLAGCPAPPSTAHAYAVAVAIPVTQDTTVLAGLLVSALGFGGLNNCFDFRRACFASSLVSEFQLHAGVGADGCRVHTDVVWGKGEMRDGRNVSNGPATKIKFLEPPKCAAEQKCSAPHATV